MPEHVNYAVKQHGAVLLSVFAERCDVRTRRNRSQHCLCLGRGLYLGQEEQRSAGPRISMLFPQLEQFRCEDGRCKEAQEKESADGQIFHILPTMNGV